jgi:hypothetical protein
MPRRLARVKIGPAAADLALVAMGLTDGAQLMRASFDVVRRDLRLLWFPVISTVYLVLTAAFWIFEGAWVKAVQGPGISFALLILAGLYSLYFVGIFFSVAVAGAAAEVVAGGEPSVGDGLNVAWSRVAGIAGWAAYSVVVGLLLGLVKSIKGLRWLGDLAQVAWSFATIFVVPLIALEGLDPESARRRSFQLAKGNWKTETGGLAALRIVLLVPGLLIYFDARLLASGHVHSLAGKALLGTLLVCGLGLAVAASVVRQVFAVTLYRIATAAA